MNKAAEQAVRKRLEYLQDNRYRYVKLGGYDEMHPTVREHDKEIEQLKQALEEG